MKTFNYTITDEVGIHARPAGQLKKKVKELGIKAVLGVDGKEADVTKTLQLMQLGVKKGQTVTISVEGDNEEEAAVALEEFFKENF
ncbi:phosphocarrier protein [Acetitomaculum ruminis DSM 5522]|uniref:Phosphocarrier protein n=1 Tax=Acetitomaculum ruminis DSM 5522 TaxID=1120918 RepID=A0A1I0YWL8_9FIRM|nr:HPr family phosphocarrier protein [Acetitomaculum ruminis]SFB16473.1 phosphocarrier protein [Acetitomaculum ruminis DSM 5522]